MMLVSEFGPFANVVAVALALVAVFASLVPRAIGGVEKWSGLADNPPTFLTLAPARIIAVVAMAVSYVTIDQSNREIFMVAAAICAVLSFIGVYRFDNLRRIHVAAIPLVGDGGQPLQDDRGGPLERRVIIGTEATLRSDAADALRKAREHGGVSLNSFMAGYGNPVNDPAALWDDTYLARVGSRVARWLTAIVLSGVLSLYLAALIVDVSS